jgi:hypothetical protein
LLGMYSGRGARTTSASTGAPPPVEARITPRPPRRVCERPAAPRARALAPRLIAAGAANCARAAADCAAIVETDWGNLDPGCRGELLDDERTREEVSRAARDGAKGAISAARAALGRDEIETQSIGGLRISFFGLLESRLAKRIDRIHPTRVLYATAFFSFSLTVSRRLSPSAPARRSS